MKGNKRKKISILNILFLVLMISLISSLVFKNRENFKNIFTKKNKIKAPEEHSANELEIGDIVYYNPKIPANKNDKLKQTVTIPVGDSANPGSGYDKIGEQTFDLEKLYDIELRPNYIKHNIIWRVWDKIPVPNKPNEFRVVLLSETIDYSIPAYGSVGYIWWEHTLHKVASIFGYGEGADTNATENFVYKVGSGIDDAPDMTEGDKGIWSIGSEPTDTINISAARALTLKDVEDKLGITEEKITKFNFFNNEKERAMYGKTLKTTIPYVPQRNIGSVSQKWKNEEGRLKGRAQNNGYKITNKYYVLISNNPFLKNIINTRYKELLFNYNTMLSTSTMQVDFSYYKTEQIFFGMPAIMDNGLLGYFYGEGLLYAYSDVGYIDKPGDYNYIRVLTHLNPNLKFYKATNEENAWDIYSSGPEEQNLKMNVLNLSNTPSDKIGVKISKVNTAGVISEDITKKTNSSKKVDGKDEYNLSIKKYTGQKREGTGDKAIFSKIDNKYNLEITGIPEGYDFKIIGKEEKQIDLDEEEKLEYEAVIYPKAGKLVIPVEYIGGEKLPADYFGVCGDIIIKSKNEELGRKEYITLMRGVNSVEIENVNLFDEKTNTLKNYTVEFKKSSGDTTSHIIEYDDKNQKLVITFVPFETEINISVEEDSKKYLHNISEIKLKLVGGEKDIPVTLKPDENNIFDTIVKVPETDKSGNKINYVLKKAENLDGYYIFINGYNLSLKPILKLPYTGIELSGKNIAIMSLVTFGLTIVYRFKKKTISKTSEYKMMK